MATIFDNHQGLWDSSIDVATVFADLFDGNHIIPPCFFQGDWFVAYRLGALDVNQSFCTGGVGTICIILVNGNNIFSQVTLLIGFGAVGYRIEGNGLNASLGINDADTIHVVDVDGVPTEIEDAQKPTKILRFKAKNTKV